MVAWSTFSRNFLGNTPIKRFILSPKPNVASENALKSIVPVRCSGSHGPRTLAIRASEFQWHKFKDLLHFYLLLTGIPSLLVITYINLFIGPAKLAPIPENYEPKHWEYYRHPISRWYARYIKNPPQQEYEKMLHHIFESQETAMLRFLETDVKKKMAERKDYMSWYTRPAEVRYARMSKEAMEEVYTHEGD